MGRIYKRIAQPLPPWLAAFEARAFHLFAVLAGGEQIQLDGTITSLALMTTAVPEPTALFLLGAGFLLACWRHRRRARPGTPA